MTQAKIQSFLGWCTIINALILIYIWLWIWLGSDWIYEVQANFFDIERDDYDEIWLMFMGYFKLSWIFFNVVPYFALRIMSRKSD